MTVLEELQEIVLEAGTVALGEDLFHDSIIAVLALEAQDMTPREAVTAVTSFVRKDFVAWDAVGPRLIQLKTKL